RNKNVILLYISVLYCFIPYLLKVTLFPIAEFYYKTYLF
ncbi:EpsG family protein, partial [Salmonella enterica]|nr:EpsG family protein [Salmonella enterica]